METDTLMHYVAEDSAIHHSPWRWTSVKLLSQCLVHLHEHMMKTGKKWK